MNRSIAAARSGVVGDREVVGDPEVFGEVGDVDVLPATLWVRPSPPPPSPPLVPRPPPLVRAAKPTTATASKSTTAATHGHTAGRRRAPPRGAAGFRAGDANAGSSVAT